MASVWREWARDPLVWLAAGFLALLFGLPTVAPVFAWAFPDVRPPVYAGESFVTLFLSHAALVAASSAVSVLTGAAVAIFATRPIGRDFRPMVDAIATIGQTFPPAAVLAVAVPAVGYGPLPTFIALAIYGLLPVIENTMAGLESVSGAVREAAQGMGLSPAQVLRDVELPLAAPTILAGVRTSVIINIGTATIGSTVGAITLGTPIIDGLVADKVPYVLQGAVVVGWLAILADQGFERLDRRLRARGR